MSADYLDLHIEFRVNGLYYRVHQKELNTYSYPLESSNLVTDAKTGFIFLGIEIVNGLIRPSKEKRDDLVDSVSNLLEPVS